MARPQVRAIRPRDDSESGSEAELLSAESENAQLSDQDGTDESASELSHSLDESEPPVETDALKDISFGALAEAQARLGPNPRKRKLADRGADGDESNNATDESKFEHDRWTKERERHSRSSKHAPTISSSRNPVTRRREVFSPPPSAKFRDPRFDAAVTSDARRGNTSSTHVASENYAFLSEYQAKEVLELKAQIKKTKDLDQQADLKRQIMSLEAKVRNADTQRREHRILQEHKKKERDAIKEGKKSRPYYLKPSEVKKQIIQERRDAMGKKARDKSDKRKKMREKTKEARDMPRVRRFID